MKKVQLILALLFLSYWSEANAQCARRQFAPSFNANPVVSLEHYRREQAYDLKHLDLAMELTDTSTELRNGRAQIVGLVTRSTDSLAFELAPTMRIDSLFLNGKKIQRADLIRKGSEVNVITHPRLDAGKTFNLLVYYQGFPPIDPNRIAPGLLNGRDTTWKKNVTGTLSQPYGASDWFPAKQVLEDKIDSVFISVTTDAKNKVASNGRLVATEPVADGKVRYRWQTRYPIAYYLISVAVSEYEEYNLYAKPASLPNDSIFIQNFIYQGSLQDLKENIDLTPALVEYFSEIYGLYPFHQEKYGNAMAPIGGGMEHQTMTTMDNFSPLLNAHELAHHWFGDHVTCASWNDLFLNEGFATYSEFLTLERFSPAFKDRFIRGYQNFVMSQPAGSVFCPQPQDVGNLFDFRLRYAKGACILHTLRFIINDDSLFFAGLRAYQQEWANCTAIVADFQRVMERVTGQDLTPFFNEWYYGEGYPTYSIRYGESVRNETRFLTIELQNEGSAPGVTPLFTNPVAVQVIKADSTTETLRLKNGEGWFIMSLKGSSRVEKLVFDPEDYLTDRVRVIERFTGRLAENKTLPMRLYPNPAREAFALSASQPLTDVLIQIYDLQGKVLRAESYDRMPAEVFITTEGLSGGLYLCTVRAQEGTFSTRLMVE